MHLTRCLVAVAALLVPAVGSAEPRHPRHHRTAHAQKTDAAKGHACRRGPVEVVAANESATFALAKCDGTADPLAVGELSILARPASAPKPKQDLESLARTRGTEIAPGIRRVDSRLVERLDLVVDHFRKAGQSPRVLLVSGYRPRSTGSYHSAGRALDFRIEGVENLAVLEFCKTLADTGCGYSPHSVFVHMDVRDPGAGHVAWIDVSRPGEDPKYVTSLPSASAPMAQPAEGAAAAVAGALPKLPSGSDSAQGRDGEQAGSVGKGPVTAQGHKGPGKTDPHPYLF